MKTLVLTFLSLILFGVVTSANAGVTMTVTAHCGCNYDGDNLVWSWQEKKGGKSHGHNSHRSGDVEDCLDPDGYLEKICTRAADDCIISGPIPDAKGDQEPLIPCGSPPTGFCSSSCDDPS